MKAGQFSDEQIVALLHVAGTSQGWKDHWRPVQRKGHLRSHFLPMAKEVQQHQHQRSAKAARVGERECSP